MQLMYLRVGFDNFMQRKKYSVDNYLLSADLNSPNVQYNIVWNEEVPLKTSLFVWCLLHNRIPTTDNLIIRRVLKPNVHLYVGSCGKPEDIDRLILSCGFFKKNWYSIFSWFGFTMVHPTRVSNHLSQFGNLGGYSRNICTPLHLIWFTCILVIWCERNVCVFQ